MAKANNFNGGSNGTTITTGNSGGASGDAFTNILGSPQYSSAHYVGSGLSAFNPTVGADTHLDWQNSATPYDPFCVRLYLRLVANVAGFQRIFVLLGSISIVSAVWLAPSGIVYVYNGYSSSVAIQLSTPLPIGAWVRLELRYIIGAGSSGTVEIWSYTSPNGSTPAEYLTSATLPWPGSGATGCEFHLQRDSGGYWYLDSPAISTTLIGSAYPPIITPVGRVVETDTARPITPRKSRLLGRTVETDTARPAGRAKTRLLGRAVEADLTQAAGRTKFRLLNGVAEADLAQAVLAFTGTIAKPAAEADLAQPITGRKIHPLGQAAEVDLARQVRPAKSHLLGRAVETDTARPAGRAKTRLLGRAVEADLARPFRNPVVRPAAETSLAQPITPILYRPTRLTAGGWRTAWRASSPHTHWTAGSPRT